MAGASRWLLLLLLTCFVVGRSAVSGLRHYHEVVHLVQILMLLRHVYLIDGDHELPTCCAHHEVAGAAILASTWWLHDTLVKLTEVEARG